MALAVGLIVGSGCGVASGLTGRVWGTVIACLPVASWFVVFGVLSASGGANREMASLGYALLGVVLGLLLGQVVDRCRKTGQDNERRGRSKRG